VPTNSANARCTTSKRTSKPSTKPDDTGESLRGIAENPHSADKTLGVSTAERKAATMSAEIIKRKLRNFPVANLTERIATA
jgi:hypothetical protein